MSGLQEVPLEELAQRCAVETARFFRRAPSHDNQFCYELLRRAFAERNEAAWGKVYAQYQSLVIGWIVEHPQFAATDEEAAYFLNSVFASMWRACSPERFTNFPDVPAVLAYLKSCVHTTIINYLRKRRPPVTAIQEELLAARTGDGMATLVLNQLARAELWHLLDSLLNNEKERLIINLCFIQGMKPRLIYEQHEATFASIQEVYRVKQNLLEYTPP